MIISGGNHMGGTGVGGGIQVRAGAYLQISGCTVTGNYATFGTVTLPRDQKGQ
jgi:hypothetical protein